LLKQYLDTPEKIEPLKLATPLLIAFALAAMWAGAWSFASRMMTRHANMRVHASVSLVGLIGLLVVDTVVEYTAFAFSARVLDSLMPVLIGVILALVLFRHMKLVSRQSSRRLAVVAASVTLSVVGGITLLYYSEASEDLNRLRYMRYLKPPGFRLVSSETSEEFFASVGTLKPRIDRHIGKD